MKDLRVVFDKRRMLLALVTLTAILTTFTVFPSQNASSDKTQSNDCLSLVRPKMPKRPGILSTIKPA